MQDKQLGLAGGWGGGAAVTEKATFKESHEGSERLEESSRQRQVKKRA